MKPRIDEATVNAYVDAMFKRDQRTRIEGAPSDFGISACSRSHREGR